MLSCCCVSIALGSEMGGMRPFYLDIKAQRTDAALLQLAEDVGIQIMFSPEVARKTRSLAVLGRVTVEEALKQLLQGTKLEYEFRTDSLILVKEQVSTDTNREVPSTVELEKLQFVEELVVTGTWLRKISPASPVTIITRTDIEKLGAHSAEDIVRSLPQNFSNLNAGSSVTNAFQETFAVSQDLGGSSAVNLRGMGIDATLTLVNGRRVAASPLFEGNFVNIANLPASAIERVEVMNDGASSIYGADAIGGVVNFILKKDFAGSETSVRYENGSNEGNLYAINQLMGLDWETGRATLNLSHESSAPVSAAKAGWTTSDLRNRGGSDSRSGLTGQPGVIRIQVPSTTPPYFSEFIRTSLPADNDGTEWVPSDFSQDNIVPGENVRTHLTTERENYSAYLNLEQRLSENIELFLDVAYNRNKNYNENTPFSLLQWVPATNAFNFFGEDVFVAYTFGRESQDGLLPYNNRSNQREQIDLNLGTTFDLSHRDWQIKVVGSYGESKSESDAAYLDRWDPELLTLLASDDLSQAINLFGNGTVQSPLIARFIKRSPLGAPELSQHVLSAVFEGSVLDMPQGEMRMALGAEYRGEQLDYGADSIRASNNGFVVKPKRNIQAGFFEISVPVVGDTHKKQGMESLLLTLGGRWEHYDIPDLGAGGEDFSEFSPKLGMAWRPVADLRVRATWSESFRAPNFSELFKPSRQVSALPAFIDPHHPGGPAVVAPIGVYGGNPTLQPETSSSYTLGFDWNPSWLAGLQVTVSYNLVEFQDRITSLGLSGNLPLEVILTNPDFAVRDEQGVLIELRSIPLNVSGRDSSSVDFDVRYEFESTMGTFNAGITGTYTGKLEDVITPGTESVVLDSTNNGPDQWRLRAELGWEHENCGANLFVNYSSSYWNVNDPARFYLQTDDVDPMPVDSYTTIDLTGFYRLPESGWQFRAGARNLFEADFPFVNNALGTPFDYARIDTRGRLVYLEVAKTFDL